MPVKEINKRKAPRTVTLQILQPQDKQKQRNTLSVKVVLNLAIIRK